MATKFKRLLTPSIPPPSLLKVPVKIGKPARTHQDGTQIKPNSLGYPRKREKRAMMHYAQRDPLPTTFSPSQTLANFYETKPVQALTNDAAYFPYKYYKITLMRGLIGLPASVKNTCRDLGLLRRFQITFRLVDAKHAGLILKVKELVKLELVNEIPVVKAHPVGFKKEGSMITI